MPVRYGRRTANLRMGRGMTGHIGDKTLARRVAPTPPDPLLVPVWVRDAGRVVPAVLLAWEKRDGSWWGLVAWDAAAVGNVCGCPPGG